MLVFYVMQLKPVSDFFVRCSVPRKVQNGNTRKAVACFRARTLIQFLLQVFVQHPSDFFPSALKAVSHAHKPFKKKAF